MIFSKSKAIQHIRVSYIINRTKHIKYNQKSAKKYHKIHRTLKAKIVIKKRVYGLSKMSCGFVARVIKGIIMLMANVSMSESKKVAGSRTNSNIILSRLVVRWRIFAKSLILWDSLVLCESRGFLCGDSLDSRGLCGFKNASLC